MTKEKYKYNYKQLRVSPEWHKYLKDLSEKTGKTMTRLNIEALKETYKTEINE